MSYQAEATLGFTENNVDAPVFNIIIVRSLVFGNNSKASPSFEINKVISQLTGVFEPRFSDRSKREFYVVRQSR